MCRFAMMRRVLLACVLAGIGAAELSTAQGNLFIGSSLNPECIGMRVQQKQCRHGGGPFPEGLFYACADLTFWQPQWIVETKAGYANLGGRHFHFHNAKVKPVDQSFGFNDPCRDCRVPDLNAAVDHFYDSRNDPAWQSGQSNRTMPAAVDGQHIGMWGRLYPRVGYVTHPSPLAASGLTAARGLSVARQPLDLWPVAGRNRLDGCRLPDCQPIVPSLSSTLGPLSACMNLEAPSRRGCHDAGANLLSVFDQAAADGRYRWVVWQRRRCTVPWPRDPNPGTPFPGRTLPPVQANCPTPFPGCPDPGRPWCAEALQALSKDNSCS